MMDNEFDLFYEDELMKIKDRLVKQCTICKGTGLDDDANDCTCYKKYIRYVKLASSNIPKEYWSLKLDDFKGDKTSLSVVQRYIDNIEKAYKNGLGLTFLGPNGRGKTFLSSIILKTAIKKDYSAFFITMAELIKLIQKGFDESDKIEYYERTIKNSQFLCLDNLGSEYRNLHNFGGFIVAEFDILMRFRKSNLLPTLLTTNLSTDEFKKAYGKSVDSLLQASNKKIVVMGDDFRNKIGSKWDTIIK